MTVRNENGVYTADETIELPRPVKGWRGMGLAEVKLTDLGDHWIWATGYQLHGGNCEGAFSPLCDRANYQAPTRQAAIKAASQYLNDRMAKHSDHPDARAVIAWIYTLIPDQFDLFAAA